MKHRFGLARSLSAVGIAWAALGAELAEAETLQVGAGKTYTTIAAAVAASGDGDVIEIDAGTYHEAVRWQKNGLTVRGVGGRPVVDMTGQPISNGKGIFVVSGADFTVENIELVGASVNDQNGAGIRWEGGGSLTVRDCVFRSNENGILGGGGAHPENVGLFERNEFVDNGRGDVGYTHAVYFGDADKITFQGNWSHSMWPDGPDVGHLFKSRARHNFVLYNRITAEAAQSSYEINMPQGGEAYVIGNLIQQRVGGQRTVISFADGDGTQYPGSKLYVVNNTIVSESTGPATFVRTTLAGAELQLVNNLVVGPGTMNQGGIATTTTNLATATPGLVDQAGFDYHLLMGSPAVDTGSDPGMGASMALTPTMQYVHPLRVEPRAAVGTIDVGAYEFGNMPPVGGDAGVGGDSSTGGEPDGGGCGCAAGGGDPVSLLTGLGVALVVMRRRQRR